MRIARVLPSRGGTGDRVEALRRAMVGVVLFGNSPEINTNTTDSPNQDNHPEEPELHGEDRVAMWVNLNATVRRGTVAQLEQLIRRGGRHLINYVRRDSLTLISRAGHYGLMQMLRVLIDAGANPHLLDGHGMTAAHHACMRGNLNVIMWLGDHGHLEVNERDADDGTLLHISASYGNVDILRELIKRGADVHLMDRNGNLALHSALTAECVYILCAAGSDPNLPNKYGITPLTSAIRDNRTQRVGVIAAMLICGASPTHDPGMINEDMAREYIARLNGVIQDLGGIEGVARAHREWIESLPRDSSAVKRWIETQPGRRTKAAGRR
jgi:ankyrin repeat protein